MKVFWIGIYDRGNAQLERIHFRALFDVDLKFYAILDTEYTGPNRVQTGNKNSYWFSDKVIKAGENVVLYTRAGAPNTETRPDGAVFHFLFRGIGQALYTNPQTCAVIFEISNWATSNWGA